MKKAKILVVEDDKITAMDLKNRLENLGYTVPAIVSTGEEAIKKATEIHPDLVLMDIVLKGEIDGIEAAKKILSIDIPLIYVTAYADKEKLERISVKPPYGYIIKPFNVEELRNKVALALYKHKAEMEEIERTKDISVSITPSIKEEKSEISKAKILVVEDDKITAMDLKNRLENLGYTVPAIVSTGEEAIKKATEINPDLVLMDVVIKGETDGVAATEEILNFDIPVICITGHSGREKIERMKVKPPYGYITKPFDDRELYSNVKMALHKHRTEKERLKTVREKVVSKKRELRLEKIGASWIAIGVMMLIVHSIISMNITWLEYVLFIPAFYGLMLTILSFKSPIKPKNGDIKPFVSIIIPAHNEENTIERCIRSMSKNNYYDGKKRNYELIVINDGSTDKTGKILEKLRDEMDFLTIITRKPPKAGKGKGFALNDGLKICNGELVAVFDADALVEPDFLEKVVPYFSDKKVAGVQTRVRMYNKDKNVLTAMQEVEFGIFGNVIQKSRSGVGLTAFFGGNGQVARKDLIEAIDGWDGYAVTEDLNLSVKFMIDDWKIRYCGETVVYQEAVPEWKAFFRQRLRWAMGNLETFFVYLKRILSAENVPIHRRIEIIQYLSSPIFLCFVMLGYVVAILYVGAVMKFKLAAPVIIGILSTLAFFPGAILGIYRDTKKLSVSICRAVEYWAYCLYLIPLYTLAIFKLMIRQKRRWAKTYHTGVGIKNVSNKT